MPVSDPKAKSSYALRLAAWNDRLEIVKPLLPTSDPKVDDSKELRFASQYVRCEIFNFLWGCSEPKKALQKIIDDGYKESAYVLIKQKLQIEDDKNFSKTL